MSTSTLSAEVVDGEILAVSTSPQKQLPASSVFGVTTPR